MSSSGVSSRIARQHWPSGLCTSRNSNRAQGGSVGWGPAGLFFLVLTIVSEILSLAHAGPNWSRLTAVRRGGN
jgi:hypothetical protein